MIFKERIWGLKNAGRNIIGQDGDVQKETADIHLY